MATLKLTEKSVSRLKAPTASGKQEIFWDAELRGFAVLCSGVTNAKTYICQRSLPSGLKRRVTIASVAETTLAKARKKAGDVLLAMRQGCDPKAKRQDLTLRAALANYLVARKDLRPRSAENYRQACERHLAKWLDRPLREITSDMVAARHTEIARDVAAASNYSGHATANSVMRTLRVLWNFASGDDPSWGPNPAKLKRQWYKVRPRDRLVRDEEMAKFYAAVTDLENTVARDFILFLMFTGLRRREASTLKWSDIDREKGVIHISALRAKNDTPLNLPMTDFVRDLLVARRAVGEDGEFVFPSSSKSGHIEEPKDAFDTAAEACNVRVSCHDLRRTYATCGESCDVSGLALKALLNHSLGSGVTEGYIKMTVERLRTPAQRIADRLKQLCGVPPVGGENVAVLRAAGE